MNESQEIKPSRQERRLNDRKIAHGKNKIPTMVLAECPNCQKPRLTKYLDDNGVPEPVSYAKITVRGEERFVDICGHCTMHYRQEDQRYVMKNLKQLQQAMLDRKADGSTDKDFSIDL
jgi:hypothetical protein